MNNHNLKIKGDSIHVSNRCWEFLQRCQCSGWKRFLRTKDRNCKIGIKENQIFSRFLLNVSRQLFANFLSFAQCRWFDVHSWLYVLHIVYLEHTVGHHACFPPSFIHNNNILQLAMCKREYAKTREQVEH